MVVRKTLPFMLLIVFASVAIIAVTVVGLFGMQLSAQFHNNVDAHEIGGYTDADLEEDIGTAWRGGPLTMLLAIPGAVLLALTMGGIVRSVAGSGSRFERGGPPPGGPPF